MPKVGAQVSYWRRDVGGPSQKVQAIVLETWGIDWCVVYRYDIKEVKPIDPNRLMVEKEPRCTCGHEEVYHASACGLCGCQKFVVDLPEIIGYD